MPKYVSRWNFEKGVTLQWREDAPTPPKKMLDRTVYRCVECGRMFPGVAPYRMHAERVHSKHDEPEAVTIQIEAARQEKSDGQ